MRNNKNNITFNIRDITLNLENIISFFRNLIGHFTDKEKIITLVSIIIMLSFVNITNTSALNYQTETNINFTFNPTLSINISPSNLVIDNLTPGTASNSNVINVSVATNSAYGYILTTSVGNNATYNTTNLVHTNGSSVFSSISTNTNLTSLEDISDNSIWGYSYKLSGDNTWSNYSGLPLYSSPLKVLLNTDSNTGPGPNSLDFKIAAKASTAQPSGAYSNVINFSAVTKPTPTTLAEAYANYYQATNKTMHNGYYVMQDMADSHICENTEVIGSELRVIDIRDDKVYWIAKLADGHCWMTQNLDLDLVSDTTRENYVALTSENTDLNDSTGSAYREGYNTHNGLITWIPENNTIDASKTYPSITNWGNDDENPYSAEPGDIYIDNSIGLHGLSGNYYNWSAAIASNNSASESNDTYHNSLFNPQNSICPKGWRLPIISNTLNEFATLNSLYNNKLTNTDRGIKSSPLYFLKSGRIYLSKFQYQSEQGIYWSSTVYNNHSTYYLFFTSDYVSLQDSRYYPKSSSASIRCLAR